MDSKRVLLLEEDPIRAGATGQMVLVAGHLVVGPVHGLEEALLRIERGGIDLALLQREFSDGTDATPAAEALSAADIRYAFVVEPGDRTKPEDFPEAVFLRRPLTQEAVSAVVDILSSVWLD